MKEKLLGVFVTIMTYLVYVYVGSFETKAASEKKFNLINQKSDHKFNKVDKKLDSIICYLDKTKCL